METRHHSTRARRALLKLAEDDPAFAALSLWVTHRDSQPIEDETGDGAWAWSDGNVIHYGPAFDQLTLAEQMSVAGHHLLHIALQHSGRAHQLRTRLGKAFQHDLFNIAADALINTTLHQAGYALPRPSVELGPLLTKALSQNVSANEALGKYDVEALYLALAGGPESGDGQSKTAQAARSHARQSTFVEDLRFEERGSVPSDDSTAAEWREHLARALEAGRQAGRGIGVLGHRIADLPVPRTPWEHILRKTISRALLPEANPTTARPARRWLAMDAAYRQGGGPQPIFEPGTRPQRDAPRLAVGVDMSSSVDDALLARFAGEIRNITARFRAETHILFFDEVVRAQMRVLPGALWNMDELRGGLGRGGGTSFIDVISRATALDASLAIILTDLDGPAGSRPKVPILWAVPQYPAPTGPFGRVVSLAR